MIKFTIAIPAYKKKYLFEAIESCLDQTYKNFELVIVDDASPEDLKSVVDKFKDDRIKYYRNEKNCGAEHVVDNWNKCLNYAKGEYIICMGDDDKLKSNCLEEYDKLIRLYPKLNVYHAWTEIIDENGDVAAMQEPRPLYESAYSMLYNRFRFDRLQYIGDWLLNVKNLKEHGGFYDLPFAWGSDDMSAFVAALDKGIANSQVPLFQYRISRYTITNTGHNEKKIFALEQMEKGLMSMLSNCDVQQSLDNIYCKLLKSYCHKYIKDRIIGQLINYFKDEGSVKDLFNFHKVWYNHLSFSQVLVAFWRGNNRKIKSKLCKKSF